jgi:two-component system sensor histidine kinase UhpB
VLDTTGLHGAVDEMVNNYNAGIPSCRFRFKSTSDLSTLESGLAIAAYRVVQEALSNVVKHASAANAAVSLALNSMKDCLEVKLSDDGIGFNLETMTPGIGIVGMRERVYAFNGEIDFRMSPGKGTEVVASVPLICDAGH